MKKSGIRIVIGVLTLVHILLFFVLPLMTLESTGSALNALSKAFGGETAPKSMTLFFLVRLLIAESGDGILIAVIMLLPLILEVLGGLMAFVGSKKKSYVGGLIFGLIALPMYFLDIEIVSEASIRYYETTPAAFLLLLFALATVVLMIVGLAADKGPAAKVQQQRMM